MTLSPDLFAQLHIAEELKIEGKHTEAIAVLENILLSAPDCVEAFEEIADNELSLGAQDRATKAAQQALSLNPKSCPALYILGFIASHHLRWKESIELLQKANHLEPNDSEILRCLGWSLFMHGDQLSGLVTLERALNLDSDSPYTLCDLGMIHLHLHDPEKALSLFEHALKIDPTHLRTLECIEMAKELQAILEHAPKGKKKRPPSL